MSKEMFLMRIAGLPSEINDQLGNIVAVEQYFRLLSDNPAYVNSKEAEHMLSSIKDEKVREAIAYIGRHNELPPRSDLMQLSDATAIQAYLSRRELGWANLRFLKQVVKTKFMGQASDKIMYSRQVALFCNGCGEYKASGMFEFETKDMSYRREVRFSYQHIIDPERTTIKKVRAKKKRTKDKIFCVPCNSFNSTKFEYRHEGPFASAREYQYSNKYLESLIERNLPLPFVVGVRIRTKEAGSEAEKLAFMLSGKGKDASEHFRILQEKKAEVSKAIGCENLEKLILNGNHTLYDTFGIRVIASSVDNCYLLAKWFKETYPTIRLMDYIAEPKSNNYQSIHMTLVGLPSDRFVREKIPVDVQIRTPEMDAAAKTGTAALGTDKKRKNLLDHKLFLAMTVFRYHLFGV